MWQANVDNVFALFDKKGNEAYLSDPLSKTEHSIQTAMAAERNDESVEVIIGAFLHDVGHLIDTSLQITDPKSKTNIGVTNHAELGAEYLEGLGFPSSVTNIVRYHVMAKKYLCAIDETYHAKLSQASKLTLLHQGGPMSENEVKEFEEIDNFQAIVRMRQYDDLAKCPDMKNMNSLDHYKSMVFELDVGLREKIK